MIWIVLRLDKAINAVAWRVQRRMADDELPLQGTHGPADIRSRISKQISVSTRENNTPDDSTDERLSDRKKA